MSGKNILGFIGICLAELIIFLLILPQTPTVMYEPNKPSENFWNFSRPYALLVLPQIFAMFYFLAKANFRKQLQKIFVLGFLMVLIPIASISLMTFVKETAEMTLTQTEEIEVSFLKKHIVQFRKACGKLPVDKYNRLLEFSVGSCSKEELKRNKWNGHYFLTFEEERFEVLSVKPVAVSN